MKTRNKFFFAAVGALIIIAVTVTSLFPSVDNIISSGDSFAFLCNHRVFVYGSDGVKRAEIDVRELGNAKLAEYDKDITVYSVTHGYAARYAVSGDFLRSEPYRGTIVNTAKPRHELSGGAEVRYTRILCYEQIKLIGGDDEKIIYNNIGFILTFTAALSVAAVIWYLKINFLNEIDEKSANMSDSTAD